MSRQSAFDFAARMPRYAVTERTTTRNPCEYVNPLRLCRVRPKATADVAALVEKLERLERLRDGTTFAGEAEAAERAAEGLRERIESIVENSDARRMTLCDGCARRFSHAIEDDVAEDGIRGCRAWRSIGTICDICWSNARRPKQTDTERRVWEDE